MAQEDLDWVVQGCLREEGEDMVADDAKKGLIPVKLVERSKEEKRALIEEMGVFDVVDRASATPTPTKVPQMHPTSEPDGWPRSSSRWTDQITACTTRQHQGWTW